MNLIEKLGGYETAYKFHLDRVNSHKTFIYDGLDKELLNYRRENNIFEVGDLYVYLNEWDSDFDNIFKFDKSEFADHLWNINSMIRHATDEEIKAGHRLNDVLD